MNQRKLNQRAILFSLLLSLILMALKFWAYWQTKSFAILTDACESIVNVVASSFAYYSVYLVTLPKDRNHPYGHGKVEFFSAGFEGAMILIAGIFTLFPAILSFFRPHEIENIGFGISVLVITIICNSSLGYYLQNLGKSNNSLTLIADGKHLVSDAVANIILVTGLFLVKFIAIPNLDSYLSLILSFYLIRSGYELLRKSVAGLMDETDYQVVKRLVEILNTNRREAWIDVHNFRVQKYGADLHIDCHLTLPYYMSLEDSHKEVNAFEEIMRTQNDSEVEVFIHSDPCLPECCSYCLLKNCPVRKGDFTEKIEWIPERLGIDAKHFASNADLLGF